MLREDDPQELDDFIYGDNHYEKMGLPSNATQREITKKYRRLMLRFHPDKYKNTKEGEALSKKLGNIYDTLKDSSKRAEYDQNIVKSSLDAKAFIQKTNKYSTSLFNSI